MPAIPIVVFVVLLCALAYGTWRSHPPHVLLLMSVGLSALFGGALVIAATSAVGATTAGAQYQIVHVNAYRTWLLNTALLTALPLAFTWAAHRFATPTLVSLQRVCVWALVVGLSGPGVAAALLGPPRRYTDYADWLQMLQTVTVVANTTAILAAVILVGVSIFALVTRRNAAVP